MGEDAGLARGVVDRPPRGERGEQRGPGRLRAAGDEVVREHTVVVAVAEEHGWTTSTVEVTDDLTALPDVPTGAAVVLDAAEDTWAASCADAVTVTVTAAVMLARRARAVPPATSSPSSVVASDVAAVARLLLRRIE